MRRGLLPLAAIVFALISVAPAEAVPITYTFNGRIEDGDFGLVTALGLTTDSRGFSWTITVESTSDTRPDNPFSGLYDEILSSVVMFGGGTAVVDAGTDARFAISDGPVDRLEIANLIAGAPAVGAYVPHLLRLSMVAAVPPGPFDSDALPLAVDASLFTSDDLFQLVMHFQRPGETLAVPLFGTVDSVAVSAPVPEPSSLLLLGIGAIGAGIRSRWHRFFKRRRLDGR